MNFRTRRQEATTLNKSATKDNFHTLLQIKRHANI